MQVPKNNFAVFLQEYFPKGTQIMFLSSADPDPRLARGDKGTLIRIDDDGLFHVQWQKGFVTQVTPGEDGFTIRMPDRTDLKLYMPLTAQWADGGDTYDVEEGEYLSDEQILSHECAIRRAMIRYREPEEAERGLMRWYGKKDPVDAKVHSVLFDVEARDGKLWGVANCRVFSTLTPGELEVLKDYVSGQASDGWGEGFEQHEIETGDGGIYVHLWNWVHWDIKTEEEQFAPKVADGLPPLCFSTLPSTGELICIKRGESGYYPSDWSTSDPAANRELADFNNQKLGVTCAQRMAMECGSMHGWNVPGANPAVYPDEPVTEQVEDSGMSMGGM